MTIEIRSVRIPDEYQAFIELEQKVWPGVDPMRNDILLIVQKSGGLVLGAFDVPTPLRTSVRLDVAGVSLGRQGQALPPREGQGTTGGKMVGLLFGFIGMTPQGRFKHTSHFVGVDPEYRDQQVGYRLKLAQRDHVLAQGIDLITWTFDPLQSRNAHLNLRKLGVVCRIYWLEFYGEMPDSLNAGVPSDRFETEWYIASDRVAERISGTGNLPSLSDLRAAGVQVVNPVMAGPLPAPSARVGGLEGEQLLIQIPSQFQDIKRADIGLARAWREHTRHLFQGAFSAGYMAVDFLHEGGAGYYLLQRDWHLD
jgi:predicted GNAT superfamily acetyltransferase